MLRRPRFLTPLRLTLQLTLHTSSRWRTVVHSFQVSEEEILVLAALRSCPDLRNVTSIAQIARLSTAPLSTHRRDIALVSPSLLPKRERYRKHHRDPSWFVARRHGAFTPHFVSAARPKERKRSAGALIDRRHNQDDPCNLWLRTQQDGALTQPICSLANWPLRRS